MKGLEHFQQQIYVRKCHHTQEIPLYNCDFSERLTKDIKNSLCDILIVKQYK